MLLADFAPGKVAFRASCQVILCPGRCAWQPDSFTVAICNEAQKPCLFHLAAILMADCDTKEAKVLL